MSNERLIFLVQRAKTKEILPEELDELMALIRSDGEGGAIHEQLNELYKEVLAEGSLQHYDTAYWQQAFQEITGHPQRTAKVHVLRNWWWAAASIAIIGIATYLLTTHTSNHQPVATTPKQDVAPGGEKAILTLADGTTIVLDNTANGTLAQQGSAEVVKLSNGQIAYNLKALPAKEAMWNTMQTPAGGQYQVTLPDGTKVWLNAASSITFPTAFTGNKREVKIKGEVYFEVTKNKQQPFMVDIDGKSTIEVLGTRFNVNAYDNEAAINTTLVEGSINITRSNQSALLKPGEQAVVTSGISVQQHANIDQVLAWKNGYFDFEGLDLKAVMRQLERWYDVQVQYGGPVDKGTYAGRLQRTLPLSEALDILQKIGGITCKLEGKIVTVR